MARPNGSVQHAGLKGRAGKRDSSAVRAARTGSSRRRTEWTWGSAAVETEGDTTVEVDEAIEAKAFKLSIDMPRCHVSIQIDGVGQLEKLIAFLRVGEPALGAFGEFRIGRPVAIWVWDDETPGRLFIWLNRSGKNSIRVELTQNQVGCIRLALTEATKAG